MGNIKRSIVVLIAIATLAVSAETNKPPAVHGNMEIRFNSRVQPGASDIYALNVNMADSVVFRGNLTNVPIIVEGTFSATIKRPSSLSYAVDLDVVNPNNPAQTRNIGKLYGAAPILMNGTYDFNASSVRVHVYATGRAPEYNSKYGGLAIGKPLYKPKNWFEDAKRDVMKVTGQNHGKSTALAVTNYDFMTFQSHRIAGGPVGIYPEATVDGKMIYDRDRVAWYFNNVTITYPADGVQKIDRLSGSVRWLEQPRKGSSRDGEYQFDIRVNEPQATEASAFTAGSDENAFFETDSSIPALIGTWKYHDSFTGEKVAASAITIELSSNKLGKQQVMNLTKLLLFTATIPFNSE